MCINGTQSFVTDLFLLPYISELKREERNCQQMDLHRNRSYMCMVKVKALIINRALRERKPRVSIIIILKVFLVFDPCMHFH